MLSIAIFHFDLTSFTFLYKVSMILKVQNLFVAKFFYNFESLNQHSLYRLLVSFCPFIFLLEAPYYVFIFLEAKFFYNQGQSARPSVRPSIRNGQLFTFIWACYNCPIDFKLCIVIPIVVRYDLESVETLISLPECPYVHFKHAHF